MKGQKGIVRVGLLAVLSLYILSCDDQKPFSLEKLIFNTTTCFGDCPALHLELNVDATFRLYVEHIWDSTSSRPDWSQMGYFEGKVSDSIYKRILTELKNLDIENQEWDLEVSHDVAFKELIIYYSDNRKSLASMSPPPDAYPLLESLYALCKTEEKMRVKDTFHLEHDTSLWNILYHDVDWFDNPES